MCSQPSQIVPARQVTVTGEDASIHLLCSSCPWSNLRSSAPPNLHHCCPLRAFLSGLRLPAGFKLQLQESWTRRRRWATRVIKNSLPIENRRWDFYRMFSVHLKSHSSHFLWCFKSPDALDSTKRKEIINTDPKRDRVGLELRSYLLSSCVLHLIFKLVFAKVLSIRQTFSVKWSR